MRRLPLILVLLLMCGCGTENYHVVYTVKTLPVGHTIEANDLQTETCDRLFDDCNVPRARYARDVSEVVGQKVSMEISTGMIVEYNFITPLPDFVINSDLYSRSEAEP